MPIQLNNLMGTFGALVSLSSFLIRNRSRIYHTLEKNIEQARENSPRMAVSEIHRLREYVLLGSTLGEMFSSLRGKPMSESEAIGFMNLSIFAPLFDDLFEQPEFAEERLLLLIQDHSQLNPAGFTERLLHQALDRIYVGMTDSLAFKTHFHQVYLAQKESKLQVGSLLSQDEIRRITLAKGGHSALLYRSLLNNPPRPHEEDAFFRLGGLIQVMDDIFDVGADNQAGIQTLATTSSDMRILAAEFETLLAEVCADFRHLGYPKSGTDRFLYQILVLASRGRICLNQFIAMQAGCGQAFHPDQFTENELICDMETPRNFLRSMNYCFTYPLAQISANNALSTLSRHPDGITV